MNQIYEKKYFEGEDSSSKNYEESISLYKFLFRLQDFKKYIEKGKLLDHGCGYGYFIFFAKKYSNEVNLPFSCNIRPEMVTEGLCKDLKRAGCTTLSIGIESGNEKLRREILRRYNSNDSIIKAFRTAEKAGLATYSFNMVGLPYETDSDVQKTIKLNQEIKPDFLQASVFQPYPGTELRRLCEEKGWLTEKDIPISHKTDSILNYPQRTAKGIKKQKQFFRYNLLKKDSLRKALLILAFDLNESLFTKLRDKIPISLKKLLFKIDSSLKRQRRDQFVDLEKISSILVFMGEGIGNLIVSTPFLKVLKRELPKTKIIFIIKTKKYPRDFFRTFPYVDQIVELDDNLFRNIKKIRELQKRKFDLIIPAFPETKVRKVLCFLLNPKYKINDNSDLVFSDKSTVEIELDVVKRFGINVEASDYKLEPFFKPDNSKKIQNIIKKQCLYRNFIGFHVGSRKSIPTRLWSADRWAKVADFLASQKSHKIIFIGGKEDLQETKKVMKLMKSPAVNLVGRLKIEETAAIMKKFKLFICANSGPMHIAAALNIPTVALCGSSPEQWHPYNKNATVIRKIINRKYCNPPCDAKKCKYEDNLCMESIKTEDVIESIRGQLNFMWKETF